MTSQNAVSIKTGPRGLPIIVINTLCLFTICYSPLLRYLLYSPWVDEQFPTFYLIAIYLWGITLALSLCSAVGSLFACMLPKLRGKALVWLVGSFAVICSCLITSVLSLYVEEYAWERAANRGQILIDAIDHYIVSSCCPPKSLNDLVPSYLSDIPTTGMSAFPNYHYQANPRTQGDKVPWEIRINLSWPIKGSSRYLYYWPTQVYPKDNKGQLRGTAIKRWIFTEDGI